MLEDQPRRKKEKKKKEKENYKSAQFIEDSDGEYGDIDAFLAKEKELREKTERAATASGGARIGTMKAHGTKKRRRKGDEAMTNKKQKGEHPSAPREHDVNMGSATSEDRSDQEVTAAETLAPPLPRPRPRPRPVARRLSVPPSPDDQATRLDDSDDAASPPAERTQPRRNRLVISDDDED